MDEEILQPGLYYDFLFSLKAQYFQSISSETKKKQKDFCNA